MSTTPRPETNKAAAVSLTLRQTMSSTDITGKDGSVASTFQLERCLSWNDNGAVLQRTESATLRRRIDHPTNKDHPIKDPSSKDHQTSKDHPTKEYATNKDISTNKDHNPIKATEFVQPEKAVSTHKSGQSQSQTNVDKKLQLQTYLQEYVVDREDAKREEIETPQNWKMQENLRQLVPRTSLIQLERALPHTTLIQPEALASPRDKLRSPGGSVLSPTAASIRRGRHHKILSPKVSILSPRSRSKIQTRPLECGGTGTVFKTFDHYAPVEGAMYFHPAPQPKIVKDKHGIPFVPNADGTVNKSVPPFKSMTAVIPFFNEQAFELSRTLKHLRLQGSDVVQLGYRMHTLIILDGWFKASKSMQMYMQDMFPDTSPNPWWNRIEKIDEKRPQACVNTYVVQKINAAGELQPVKIGYEKNKTGEFRPLHMKLTLLVKRDNRRKHNSHEWFLKAFAPHYHSEFVFLTDCGTLFAPRCLYSLVYALEHDKTASAVSGRQRVMTAEMQGEKNETWRGWFYRHAQCYDYESSLASFTGAFSLIGMLPVIPGPCGLYRFSIIYNQNKYLRNHHNHQLPDARPRPNLALPLPAQGSAFLLPPPLSAGSSPGYAGSPSASDSPIPNSASSSDIKSLDSVSSDSLDGFNTPPPPLLVGEPATAPSSMFHRPTAYPPNNNTSTHVTHVATYSPVTTHSTLALVPVQQQQQPTTTALQPVAPGAGSPGHGHGHSHGQAKGQPTDDSTYVFEHDVRKFQEDDNLELGPLERCSICLCGAPEEDSTLDAVDFYFSVVNQDPEDSGMLLATLKLAEDRILSYAAVLKSKENAHTKYIQHAVFYFEAETNPMLLLQQRRRWINGTVAGYIWLMMNLRLVFFSQLSYIQIPALIAMIFAQTMMYAVVAIAPAIFALGLHFSANATLSNNEVLSTVDMFLWGYIAMYILFVLVHNIYDTPKLHQWIFDISTLVNVLVSVWLLVVVCMTCYSSIQEGGILNLPAIIWIVIGTIAFPFVLALMYSPYSFFLMLKSWFCFFIFLPTMVGFFGAYAFARTWELTWGNRPSDNLDALKTAQKEAQDRAKEVLRDRARFICWIIVIANVAFAIAVTRLESLNMSLIIIGGFVAVWAAVQMVFSFIHAIIYNFQRAALVLKYGIHMLARWHCSPGRVDLRESGLTAEDVHYCRKRDYKWDTSFDVDIDDDTYESEELQQQQLAGYSSRASTAVFGRSRTPQPQSRQLTVEVQSPPSADEHSAMTPGSAS